MIALNAVLKSNSSESDVKSQRAHEMLQLSALREPSGERHRGRLAGVQVRTEGEQEEVALQVMAA